MSESKLTRSGKLGAIAAKMELFPHLPWHADDIAFLDKMSKDEYRADRLQMKLNELEAEAAVMRAALLKVCPSCAAGLPAVKLVGTGERWYHPDERGNGTGCQAYGSLRVSAGAQFLEGFQLATDVCTQLLKFGGGLTVENGKGLITKLDRWEAWSKQLRSVEGPCDCWGTPGCKHRS